MYADISKFCSLIGIDEVQQLVLMSCCSQDTRSGVSFWSNSSLNLWINLAVARHEECFWSTCSSFAWEEASLCDVKHCKGNGDDQEISFRNPAAIQLKCWHLPLLHILSICHCFPTDYILQLFGFLFICRHSYNWRSKNTKFPLVAVSLTSRSATSPLNEFSGNVLMTMF